jgi:hypothetical protein
MVMIGANGNKIAYGIKHYNVDTEDDRLAINTFNLTPGTTAFVIENSKHYMLNGSRKWVEITPFGKGSSSGGGQDGGDIDEVPDDNPGSEENGDDNGIYDGGDLDG